jgi:hypothetical protein
MNILNLVEEDLLANIGAGRAPKLVARTNGGEYASPCPHPECGGKDRFRIWPNDQKGPRFWCRRCERGGNIIEYLKEYRGMTVREAVRFVKSNGMELPKRTQRTGNRVSEMDREQGYPSYEWQKQAHMFIEKAEECLWSGVGKHVLSSLFERGIAPPAIKNAHLGWNPEDIYDSRERWGLEEVVLENSKPKKLLIPKGLVIPAHSEPPVARVKVGKTERVITASSEHVFRLRVRSFEPHADPKYRAVAGSKTYPMFLPSYVSPYHCVVVESELDGILLNQRAGELTSVLALGSAHVRPDLRLLKRFNRILVSLDNDEAGEKAFFDHWADKVPNCHMWPALKGKDPGEAFQNGFDIRSWICAGFEDELRKEEAAKLAEEQFEQERIAKWRERRGAGETRLRHTA